MRRRSWSIAMALATPGATMANAGEVEALALPAVVHEPSSPNRSARVEAWGHYARWRRGEGPVTGLRLALDWRQTLEAERNSVTFSNRLELARAEREPWGRERWRNSLRELFFSQRLGRGLFLDAGRVNARQGVSAGYNPTDPFRAGAVVSRLSEDPAAWRDSRLGTVLVRVQRVSGNVGASFAIAPRLTTRNADARPPWAVGLNRTNRRELALAKLSWSTASGLAPEVLLSRRAGERPRAGLNVSAPLGNSVVLTGEWSGQKQPGLAGGAHRQRHQLALGTTWTTPWGATLTLEHHYSQLGLTGAQWEAWRRGDPSADPAALEHLLQQASWQQEPLTRHSLFARVAWSNAWGVRGFDAAALGKLNPHDGSALWQLESHWHTGPWTLSALATGWSGADDSQYGRSPLERTWAVRVSWHF